MNLFLNLLSVSKSFVTVVLHAVAGLLRSIIPSSVGYNLYIPERKLFNYVKYTLFYRHTEMHNDFVNLVQDCIMDKHLQTPQYLSEILSILNLANIHVKYKPHDTDVMKTPRMFTDAMKLDGIMYYDPNVSTKAMRLCNYPKVKSIEGMPGTKHFVNSLLYNQAMTKVVTKYTDFKQDIYRTALTTNNSKKQRFIVYTLLRKKLHLIKTTKEHYFRDVVVEIDKKYHHIYSDTADTFKSFCFYHKGSTKTATKTIQLYRNLDWYVPLFFHILTNLTFFRHLDTISHRLDTLVNVHFAL
jgi:hypothetical protein